MGGPRSCGFAIVRNAGQGVAKLEVLLMQHQRRLDTPKGHVDAGETDLQTAYRELVEETGIERGMIVRDPAFMFVERYMVQYRGRKKETYPGAVEKTLVMFLGYLPHAHADAHILHTEHIGHEWVPLFPRRTIQKKSIDPLFDALEKHFAEHGVGASTGSGST